MALKPTWEVKQFRYDQFGGHDRVVKIKAWTRKSAMRKINQKSEWLWTSLRPVRVNGK